MKMVYLGMFSILTAGQLALAQWEPSSDDWGTPPPPPPKKTAPAAPAKPAPPAARPPRPAQPSGFDDADVTPPPKRTTPPAVIAPRNSVEQAQEIRHLQMNQMRGDIVTQAIRKLGYPANVQVRVSSLRFSWNLFAYENQYFEMTLGAVWRGIQAGARHLPGSGGTYYNGLHPHVAEFVVVDPKGPSFLAYCMLDFHRSRELPDRIFMRTRNCKLKDLADKIVTKGFELAALAHLTSGRVDKVIDFTNTDLINSSTRLHTIFLDPDVFDPQKKSQQREQEANFGDS